MVNASLGLKYVMISTQMTWALGLASPTSVDKGPRHRLFPMYGWYKRYVPLDLPEHWIIFLTFIPYVDLCKYGATRCFEKFVLVRSFSRLVQCHSWTTAHHWYVDTIKYFIINHPHQPLLGYIRTAIQSQLQSSAWLLWRYDDLMVLTHFPHYLFSMKDSQFNVTRGLKCWKLEVAMMPSLSPLEALYFVVMTTCVSQATTNLQLWQLSGFSE